MPTEPEPTGSEPPTFWARTETAAATQALAAELAALLADGDLLVLAGDLGAGKTCFTQGLARGLGITERVTSPTFTLAQRYEGRLVLNHLDVYRIDDLGDTLDLDLPELLEDGVTVIEWGERILPVLGTERLLVRLWLDDDDDDARWIEVVTSGDRWSATELDGVLGRWRVPAGPDREQMPC